MKTTLSVEPSPIQAAWQGRISGCLLGKPLEVLSFQEGRGGVRRYLDDAGAIPLRAYVPLLEGTLAERTARRCCAGLIERAEADDDIDYTLLALILLETHGVAMTVEDVARAWLKRLPAGRTWTAERAAYRRLLNRMDDEFVNGAQPGFDLAECADNAFNEWIGAQIRTDLYGWVCPGNPELAAELAARDASLSHRGEGIHAAVFVAALAAAIPAAQSMQDALDVALQHIPADSRVADAVSLARALGDSQDAVDRLYERFGKLSPIHAVNNLALVVWAVTAYEHDFSAAVGNVVMAGWDTDCNGATVGGLLGLAGTPIPESWIRPWGGRIATNLSGSGELNIADVVARTVAVAKSIGTRAAA